MKLYSKILLSAVAVLMAFTESRAQLILLEKFDNGIPASWTIRDVDGQTPYSGDQLMDLIGFSVGDAWKGTTDPNDAGNPVAMSHSWYDPIGASDDWIITPALTLGSSTDLIWKAQTYGSAAYRDGYEVRISTTDTAIASFLANPALFTIAAEGNNWNSHTVNLATYANQTVYIAFRNTSLDKYLLAIDDITVIDGPFVDGEIAGEIYEYGLAPLEQLNTVAFNDLQVNNVGTGDLTNVYGRVLVAYDGVVIYADSTAPIATVPAGDTVVLDFTGSFVPADTGLYIFLTTLHSDLDLIGANDTLVTALYVNDSVFSRDNGDITGASLGIGYQAPDTISQGGYLGNSYVITTAKVLTSVTAGFNNYTEGDSTNVSVLAFNNGVPGAVLAVSNTHVFGPAGGQVVDFVFPTQVILQPDTYVIVVREYSEYVGILTTPNNTPGTTFVQFPVGSASWFNNESVGFNVSYVIRANFGACSVPVDSAYVLQPSCPDSPDGLVILYPTNTHGTLTYDWSNGDTDSIADFLSGQVYDVTLTSGLGCESTVSYDLALVAPIDITADVTDASTETTADGSVTVTVTGGTAPYTYEWSGGNTSTTATASGLAVGTVTVTVTDANGCDQTATATVAFGVGLFNVVNTLTANVYPNPANNQLFVEVSLEKSSNVEIAIVNTLGQVVLSQNEQGQVIKSALNISSLPAGVYLVQISSENATATEKLVIE